MGLDFGILHPTFNSTAWVHSVIIVSLALMPQTHGQPIPCLPRTLDMSSSNSELPSKALFQSGLWFLEGSSVPLSFSFPKGSFDPTDDKVTRGHPLLEDQPITRKQEVQSLEEGGVQVPQIRGQRTSGRQSGLEAVLISL